MTTILVVDDSEVDRRLIAGLLKNALDDRERPSLRIEVAENGKEALSWLEQESPDLVLTDLMMPEMDGLQLVRVLRERFAHIPVILMTAYGNESIAVEALSRGAASYVPKAQQAERLGDTVRQVLARAGAVRDRERLAASLVRLDCTFRLENDPELVPRLVDFLQQLCASVGTIDATEEVRMGVALEEALHNAMYHGNLEFTARELAEAKANQSRDQLAQLIKSRSGQPPYRERRIIVEVSVSETAVRFVVRDGGAGFDVAAASCLGLADHFERGRARGMLLMQTLMDEILFNTAGNEVTLTKRLNGRRGSQRRTQLSSTRPA